LFSGFGNYWHSANEDIEDGLAGRDAYFDVLALTPAIMHYRGLALTPEQTNMRLAKQHLRGYTEDIFRLQYSSIAFWSELFDMRHGMDAFLLQELLNLILMIVGIFYLSRHAFSMTPMASALAAGISTGNSFYMLSYYSGHEGSLMYGALIPALLFLALVKDNARCALTGELIFGGLITISIINTYPHPLALIAAPLFLYWFFCLESVQRRFPAIKSAIESNPVILIIAIIAYAILTCFVLAELWHLTERFRAVTLSGRYRAMGYTHDWVIIPMVLGLIPAPGHGFLFIGNIIGKPAYLGFLLVSILFAVILAVFYFKARPSKNSDFFLVFGCFWIIDCFIFIYFITDSYFIYKFLYVHQFVIVIGIAAYVSRTRSRSIKLLCAVIVMANLASDLAWGYSMFRRPYNKGTGQYTGKTPLNRALLSKSYVEPYDFNTIVVRQTLKARGIQTEPEPQNADYFIVSRGREPDITGSQLTETVGEIAGFDIKRAPAKNYLWISSYYDPEQFTADPVLESSVFRWAGDRVNKNINIFIIRPSAPEEMMGRYLQACFQKGPSAKDAINITVSASGKEVLSKFRLDGGVHCEWIPAERVVSAAQPLVIRSDAIGESLLPYDDRILMYRVFAVGWTDRIYDDGVMSFFNATPDIVKKGSKKAEEGSTPIVTINLGQGWEAYESFGGLNFRWAGRSTELVLTGADKDGLANVAVELEPGPSHGKKVLELEVWDRAGNLIFTSPPITGRNSVVLPLNYRKQKTSVYVLKTRSLNLPVPGDSRILNYRVFNIALQ
jgi:hypothetical protein